LPFQEPGEALAFVGPDAVAVSAVGNADGLASQGGGLPQSAGISLGAGALARLQADFVVATGGIALRLAKLSRSVQFIARIAEAGAVQVAAAMRTAQRTGGHTVVAVVEHEVREAPADAARQAEAVLLAPLPAVGDALAPIVLVPPPALAAHLDLVEVRVGGAVAHDLHLLVVLEEHRPENAIGYYRHNKALKKIFALNVRDLMFLAKV